MAASNQCRGNDLVGLEEVFGVDLSTALKDFRAVSSPQDRATKWLAASVRQLTAARKVGAVLEAEPVVVSTGILRSLRDTERFWREVNEEFGLLGSTEVALLLGSRSGRSYAARLRSAGKLLAVKRMNKYLYPGFQFANGQVRPVISRLVAASKDLGKSESGVIVWLMSPTSYLNDRRPVDLLDSDPQKVLETARHAWGVEW
ncbi:hypothetical protein [Diaminobutyricimonas sp. LJ205]|uniref:hypothetical protein n=1 Tax=Diaminobutyricimonas sp. LJ205 TaxID=2683590 RepID=UPI0012F4F969|nr:hypothetical protein [Diaminobutyricimonas sp. LJ205]